MISFRHKGDFSKTTQYLKRATKVPHRDILDRYGGVGGVALVFATLVKSGQTANSWFYEIEQTSGSSVIRFNNSHINKGVPIAIILQYGHGTGTGGWVEGRDYINPAVRPVFDRLVSEVWREVTKL